MKKLFCFCVAMALAISFTTVFAAENSQAEKKVTAPVTTTDVSCGAMISDNSNIGCNDCTNNGMELIGGQRFGFGKLCGLKNRLGFGNCGFGGCEFGNCGICGHYDITYNRVTEPVSCVINVPSYEFRQIYVPQITRIPMVKQVAHTIKVPEKIKVPVTKTVMVPVVSFTPVTRTINVPVKVQVPVQHTVCVPVISYKTIQRCINVPITTMQQQCYSVNVPYPVVREGVCQAFQCVAVKEIQNVNVCKYTWQDCQVTCCQCVCTDPCCTDNNYRRCIFSRVKWANNCCQMVPCTYQCKKLVPCMTTVQKEITKWINQPVNVPYKYTEILCRQETRVRCVPVTTWQSKVVNQIVPCKSWTTKTCTRMACRIVMQPKTCTRMVRKVTMQPKVVTCMTCRINWVEKTIVRNVRYCVFQKQLVPRTIRVCKMQQQVITKMVTRCVPSLVFVPCPPCTPCTPTISECCCVPNNCVSGNCGTCFGNIGKGCLLNGLRTNLSCKMGNIFSGLHCQFLGCGLDKIGVCSPTNEGGLNGGCGLESACK